MQIASGLRYLGVPHTASGSTGHVSTGDGMGHCVSLDERERPGEEKNGEVARASSSRRKAIIHFDLKPGDM